MVEEHQCEEVEEALEEVVVVTAEAMEVATVHHEVVVTEEVEADSEAEGDTRRTNQPVIASKGKARAGTVEAECSRHSRQ